MTVTRTLHKKWIWVFSVFIAIIPTHLLCQCRQTIPKLNFKEPYSSSEREIKFRRCLFMSSIKREIRHFQLWSCKKGKKMYKKVWCTCKVVVLLIKPIVFLMFSLLSASLDLKVPNKATDAYKNAAYESYWCA